MRTPAHSSTLRAVVALAVVLSMAAVVLVVVLSSRGSGAGPDRFTYVALGDSYTAAPYVPPTSAVDPCLRSGSNYPHLISEAIPTLDLTDVSCGGATTANMTEPQLVGTSSRPPQFDALDEDTDLVSIGIGGNDFSLFGSLIYACFPGVETGTLCHTSSPRGDELQALINLIQGNVRTVLDDIAARAPDARIVVVPYPQVLSVTSSCTDRVPFGIEDTAYIADVIARLSTALVAAADEAGAEYVDVLDASAGHDICAEDPWVMGSETDQNRAASFHPLPEGQEAVASLLRDHLCESGIGC